MVRLFTLALTLLAAIGMDAASAERRVALVIGIDHYQEVPNLEKAVGDARAMAAKLTDLGFEVTQVLDPDRRALNRAIADFGASLGEGDTAFVHYSGHGVEIDRENYLLPADIPAPASGRRDFVKAEAISMSALIDRIAGSGADTRVFVVDACRDNPFAQAGVRSVGNTRGLARVDATEGTFILYSAGYGQLALDRLGPDDNEATSVYTRTLLKHLGTPGRAIDDVAQDVRREVEELARRIGHNQRPAYYDELSTRLVLVPKTAPEEVEEPSPRSSAMEQAARVWDVTKDTTSTSVLEIFARRFEGTIFAEFAKARIEELQRQSPAGVETALLTPHASGEEPSPAAPKPGPDVARQPEPAPIVAKHTYVGSRGDCERVCNAGQTCIDFHYIVASKRCDMNVREDGGAPPGSVEQARVQPRSGSRAEPRPTGQSHTYVGAQSDCRNLCERDRGCGSFRYDPTTKRCDLSYVGESEPRQTSRGTRNVLSETYVGRDADCARLCGRTSGCSTYSYAAQSKKCELVGFSGN